MTETVIAAALQRELVQKAIAWARADRTADDHSATLARLEDELEAQRNTIPSGPAAQITARPRRLPFKPSGRQVDVMTVEIRTLLEAIEPVRAEFHLASRHAEQCEEAFHQVARQLADLEERHEKPVEVP